MGDPDTQQGATGANTATGPNADLSLVLEPAQAALRKAFDGNAGAKVQFMYPDGVDHIHVKALV